MVFICDCACETVAPGFQTCDDCQESADALAVTKARRKDKRCPHLWLRVCERTILDEPTKVFRSHADNSLRFAIQQDAFPDDLGVSRKSFFPEAVTKNDDVVMAGFAIFSSKTSTQDWSHAQHGKEIRGNILKNNFLREPVPCVIRVFIENGGHLREHVIPALPIQKIRRRNRVVWVFVLRIIAPIASPSQPDRGKATAVAEQNQRQRKWPCSRRYQEQA